MAKKRGVTRRVTTGTLGNFKIIGALMAGLKGLLRAAIILAVLAFSLNLVMKYVVGAMKTGSLKTKTKIQASAKPLAIKAPVEQILGEKETPQSSGGLKNPFRTAMYTIIGDETLTVFNDGSYEKNDGSAGTFNLPVITGEINKESANKNDAFKQILKLDKKYLTDISEVRINNPKEIVMITVGNKVIRCGASVTNEKMSNYAFVMRTVKRMHKKYSSVDLSAEDKVIIK
ncbi:MAG: cell division protein FtsQ/DivIB [bacterium]